MTKMLTFLQGRQDLFLIGLLMATVLVMIVPLPTWMIDLLIAANLTLTLMVLVVAVYLKRPDDFSAFPAVILIATTFRLAITISTTRLILAEADAGAIVDTFGSFVTNGSVVVGLVIFLIITTVQFVVVTKGSERVAEVAARFTLDGLPGRQLSIDSELRAGDITAAQAQDKRKRLEKENQFFGAMDGAMKFVKGDAIAGLIVVAINILGGISVGMLSEGMDASSAIQVYSRLTIGDGLVAQIPALIIAMCAGTIITRVTTGGEDSDLGTDLVNQLVTNPKSMYLVAGLMGVMALIPGFPKEVFIPIALGVGSIGYFMAKRARNNPDGSTGLNKSTALGSIETGELSASDYDIDAKPGDTLALAMGSQLYKSISKREFAQKRANETTTLIDRFGLAIPPFGSFEDKKIGANDFSIILDSVSGFQASVPDGVAIAQCDQDLLSINNFPLAPLDSAWRMKSCFWVDADRVKELEDANITVMSVEELLAMTTVQFIRRNISRLIGYNEVQQVVRDLSAEHDNLATQISQSITAVQLLAIVRRLTQEDVPLIPRRVLFEALLEATVVGGSTSHFIQASRIALSRQICAGIADENQIIAGYMLEPDLELALRECLMNDGEDLRLAMPAHVEGPFLANIRENLESTELGATDPVLLTSPELRNPIYEHLHAKNIDVSVMSYTEISKEFRFHPIATIPKAVPSQQINEPAAA